MHWLSIRAVLRSSLPGHINIFQTPRLAAFLHRHPDVYVEVMHDVMDLHQYIYEYDLATARRRLLGFTWGNA